MRTLLLALIMLAGTLNVQAGGDEKLINAIKGNLTLMDSAKTLGDMQNVANKFERIANAEKKEWIPYYYAAQCYVLISYMDEDSKKMDSYLDKSQELLDMAKKNTKKNAEVEVLQSWIYSAKIGVNPMVRGPKYSGLSNAALKTAKEYDADCPRIYYLQGTSKYYTPEQWGGSKSEALKLFTMASDKFKTFKPKSEIHPNWGLEQTNELLEKSREAVEKKD